jgi:hypothetical protein
MDWLTFFANIVSSMAWPTAAVLAALALRMPLQQLFALLTKLRYGDLELNFERSAERLDTKAAAALPPTDSGAAPAPTLISPEVASLAEKSPRAAIVESWIHLSSAALRALKRKGVAAPTGKHVAPQAIEHAIGEAGLLDEGQLQLLRQLRNMRNAAVHGPEFALEPGAALNYVATANRLARYLDQQSKTA